MLRYGVGGLGLPEPSHEVRSSLEIVIGKAPIYWIEHISGNNQGEQDCHSTLKVQQAPLQANHLEQNVLKNIIWLSHSRFSQIFCWRCYCHILLP